jgi:hypothetical protein
MLIGLQDKKKQSGLPFQHGGRNGRPERGPEGGPEGGPMVGNSRPERGPEGCPEGGANGRKQSAKADPKDPFLAYWP